MSEDLSTKRVLCYDNGLFVSLALRLAATKQFASVDYFREWQDGFTDGRELIIGCGLEDFGVSRLKYFWPAVDDYDLFVFPDCWNGDLQNYLRSIGKRVWGGASASDLELARWKTKDLIKEIGLPVNEAEKIHGIENLRVYLKENEGVFVKISALRGLGETFESKNYGQSKGQLDELRDKYGALMDAIDFVVEKAIPDATEVGYDGFCIDGEFPDSAFIGVEIKDQAYFGKLVKYDDLPESVKDTNTKLSYHMDGYRQFFSTEIREKDGEGFLIDVTARHASPAGETYCEAFDNLPEILYHGADGVLIQPETSSEFCAQILLCSEWAEKHSYPVTFPDEIRPFVKLHNHCRIDGIDVVMPQLASMKQVGSVVGLGKTVEEAVCAAKERAEKVSGYDLEMETDALDKAVEEMQQFL